MRPLRTLTALVALCLLLPSCAWLALSSIATKTESHRSEAAIQVEQDLRPPPRSGVAEIVAAALPAVVNVRVSQFGGGEGEGSGVVIDEEGVILTNNHVVEGAQQIEVVFNDQRSRMDAEVLGTVPDRDLAVLKVGADDLTSVEIGNSSRLRLGDEVIAIGFPLDLGVTVTRGIVSGEERTISAPRPARPDEVVQLQGLLQTDAAINPGNSGGALLDRAGRLIGINTAVASLAENIGFAIAIDSALPIIQEILSEPPERQAWLGVASSTFEDGVIIEAVYPGTPAAEAGLEEGWVITSIEGQEIASSAELTELITAQDPGDTVSIEFLTGSGSRTIRVQLARRPGSLPVD